nr:hypothetical protein [Tanacetum cinerariifolium]
LMGNSIPMLQSVKTYLGKCFAMKDLGEAAYILGIKIYQDRSKQLIGLCQSAYIEKILKLYCMENSKRGSIPMQEKLKLSKSQGASTPAEMKSMQNVPYASAVGSIMNTKDMFLVYEGDLKRELRVSCYTDAGYLTDADDLKSQTGYVFVLNGVAFDWKSAKQSIFATSSVEAEYIVAFDAFKEAVCVRKFISGLSVVPTIEEPISMYCDNTGAIAIANESGITKGARHLHAKVYYLREVIELSEIKLEKVHTDDNLADPFIKALAFPKHSEHTKNIGMLPTSSLMKKCDILLVQIYVDDIIFGYTNKDLCKAFEKLTKNKFQMSLMGELTFFLGLQVKQKQYGKFISHDKYVAEILRKFGLTDRKSASTPIDTEKPLLKDPDGEDVDVHTYRSMIGSLMYLT